MNAMLLFLALSQCSNEKQVVHFNYNEQVYSRKNVQAIMPDGSRIIVPVINGFMPTVDTKYHSDGSIVREFKYNDRILFKGKIPITYEENNVKLPLKKAPTVTEKFEFKKLPKVSNDNDDEKIISLEKKIADLILMVEEMKNKPQEIKPEPKPEKPELKPGMKRPSEIK